MRRRERGKERGGFFAARQRTVNPSVKSRCAFLPCLFAVNKPDSFVGKGGRTCLARDDLRLPDCFSLSRLFPSPLACHHCSLILRVVPVKAAATSVYVLCHTYAIATISRCIRSFFSLVDRLLVRAAAFFLSCITAPFQAFCSVYIPLSHPSLWSCPREERSEGGRREGAACAAGGGCGVE